MVTTNVDKNCIVNKYVENTEIGITYNDISNLFKKIKQNGILNKSVIIDTYNIPDNKLLENDFIDKVIYYRIQKHYSISEFTRKIR